MHRQLARKRRIEESERVLVNKENIKKRIAEEEIEKQRNAEMEEKRKQKETEDHRKKSGRSRKAYKGRS